jgi:MFS family permease
MGFLYDVLYLAVLLWTFLFFGAACIPIGTGIMISSVRKDCQATSSSLSQLIFNLLGYFLSPILTGFVMDCFEEKRMGFIWGMRVVYWWVIFAVVYFLASFIIAYKKYEKYKDDENDEKDLVEDDDEMEKELREFMQLEIKRRLAQNNTFI